MTNSTTARDDDQRDPTRVGPYAEAARAYRTAGWRGVLPVVGKKGNLPREYTGQRFGERYPADDQVESWIRNRGVDNLAVRLHDGVVAVDVDAYGGRAGLETLLRREAELGDLPPTWVQTARGDATGPGDSGHRLYRVPTGRRWRDVGTDVQLVWWGHRYLVSWPSVNPDSRTVYRWYRPDGAVADGPPRPTDLPELPTAWVEYLQGGSATGDRADGRGDAGTHASEDAEAVDADGERVDPDLVLLTGLPVGEQQNGLFRYACSLRERRLRRSEMLVLLMAAIQVLDNAPDREPWTPQHVTELVDRVRRTYPPGTALTPELRDLTARLAGAARPNVQVQEGPPRAPLATDLGNSLRFARLHADRVRYVADLGRWYLWNGRRWAPDVGEGILDLTKTVIDAIRAQALTCDGREREAWLQWAYRSEALDRRRAAVGGARSEPGLVVTSSALDRDPDLLVVRNGTVDLRTGELRSSDSADLCAHQAEVEFQPDATAPRWEAHVDLLTGGDPELAAYLRRAVGYTLTGNVGQRAFFFLEGDGTNGKNAFVEPVVQVLGSYAQAASTALLTGGDDQHPTILADLLGARLVFVDETRQGRQLNVERIKALTGSKRVRARRMREDFFEFDARFKLWIAGNGRPTVRDSSDGVWARMHHVVCRGKVQPDRLVRNYGDLLYHEEASGILNWALAGLGDWRARDDLAVPVTVRRDVQEYRDEEDYPRRFVDETLERGDVDAVLPSDLVYRAYHCWAVEAGLRGPDLLNKIAFGRALGRLGLTRDNVRLDGRMTRVIQGIRWRNDTVRS